MPEIIIYTRPSQLLLAKYQLIETNIEGIFLTAIRPGISSMVIFCKGLVSVIDERNEEGEEPEYCLEDENKEDQIQRLYKIKVDDDKELDYLLGKVFCLA